MARSFRRSRASGRSWRFRRRRKRSTTSTTRRAARRGKPHPGTARRRSEGGSFALRTFTKCSGIPGQRRLRAVGAGSVDLLTDTLGEYSLLGMANRAASLPVIGEAFVSEDRRAEIRRRLKRARGQVDGIERMLDGNRPCREVLQQIAAAQEALRAAGRVMVRNY